MYHDDYTPLAQLDLEPAVCALTDGSGPGWAIKKARAVEAEYRCFLYLVRRYPSAVPTPRADVGQFWQCHARDEMKYARDCETVFGYFLPLQARAPALLPVPQLSATETLSHGARFFRVRPTMVPALL